MSVNYRTITACVAFFAGALAFTGTPAAAQTFAAMPQLAPQYDQPRSYQPQYDQPQYYQAQSYQAQSYQAQSYQAQSDQTGDAATDDDLGPTLRRQVVDYPTGEPAGTIVIDTPHTFLYLTLGGGKAMRYGIGVGREGFTWSGTETIVRKAEWPDWYPPAEMVARQPYLPRFVAGGPGNPLGARAMYLGHTDYRIHGTNDPSSIGKHMSSGCIRLLNADVTDLYGRVGIGTKVVVLPNSEGQAAVDATRRVASQDVQAPRQPLSLRASQAASVY